MSRDGNVALAEDPIPRSLRIFYRPEAILTAACRSLSPSEVEIDFRFPEYARAKQDMGHVSAIQISAAIIEGGYCAIENGILYGQFPKAATIDWFYQTLASWIALRLNVLFRRALTCGSVGTLRFNLIDVGTQRLRHRRLSMTVEFDGFCSGEQTWVIEPPPGMKI